MWAHDAHELVLWVRLLAVTLVSPVVTVIVIALGIVICFTVLGELEGFRQTSLWAHGKHVLWFSGAIASVSTDSAVLIVTVFICPCYAVRIVTIKVLTGKWTHDCHVIWVVFTLSQIGLEVTGLIRAFWIFPGLTVLSVSEWLWETGFWTHMVHVLAIGIAVTHMSLTSAVIVTTVLVIPSLAVLFKRKHFLA
jgi:hypothetical protein